MTLHEILNLLHPLSNLSLRVVFRGWRAAATRAKSSATEYSR